GILAEDNHVDLIGPLIGRFHALEVAHRPNAGVEVEADPQENVDTAEAAADRRGQRPLEAEAVMLKRLQAVVGKIEPARLLLAEGIDLFVLDLGIIDFPGDVAGVNVEPMDAAFALVRLLDRGIEDTDRTRRDAGSAA